MVERLTILWYYKIVSCNRKEYRMKWDFKNLIIILHAYYIFFSIKCSYVLLIINQNIYARFSGSDSWFELNVYSYLYFFINLWSGSIFHSSWRIICLETIRVSISKRHILLQRSTWITLYNYQVEPINLALVSHWNANEWSVFATLFRV